MSRLVLILPLFFLLPACFYDGFLGGDTDTVDPEIFSPDLSLEGSNTELLAKSKIEIADTDQLSALVSKLVPRLISQLAMFNSEADLLASSEARVEIVKPAFKLGSRVFHIQKGQNCQELEENADPLPASEIDIKNLENKQSIFWDDADNSTTISEGDRWIRLYSQCEEPVTQKFTTGTIYYSNIHNQQEVLTGEADASALADMGVQMRLQISFEEGATSSSILFENFSGSFSRNEDTGSYFSIKPGSRSTAANANSQYIFEFDNANVFYLFDEEYIPSETFSFSGKYYDDELDGYVVIDKLSIELDVDFESITSMSISINGDAEDAEISFNGTADAVLSVGEEEVSVTMDDLFDDGSIKMIEMF